MTYSTGSILPSSDGNDNYHDLPGKKERKSKLIMPITETVRHTNYYSE